MREEQFVIDEHGAEDELAYWENVFSNYASKGNKHLDVLLSPSMPLQQQFIDIIASYQRPDGHMIKVLDVGCGPLSVIGKSGPYEVDLVGIDPLSGTYQKILERHGLVSPHLSIAGMGEQIDTFFSAESVDFIHSRNALDHCEDPRVVIRNMITLAKPNSKIFINVCQNEGENASYSGFHRWNFDEVAGRIIIWNPGSVDFLDSVLGGLPYRYRRYAFRDDKVFPDQFDIVIHKNAPNELAMKEIRPGIRAMFSRRHAWVTIECESKVDSTLSWFVHGFRDKNLFTLRPYAGTSRKKGGPYYYLKVLQTKL
ncbi:MAG: methyltransferase domain-containing protein [Rhodospirillales bacterium]|nr:methyltransferase domain-containing protein [Rhodospirillales bacterium]